MVKDSIEFQCIQYAEWIELDLYVTTLYTLVIYYGLAINMYRTIYRRWEWSVQEIVTGSAASAEVL